MTEHSKSQYMTFAFMQMISCAEQRIVRLIIHKTDLVGPIALHVKSVCYELRNSETIILQKCKLPFYGVLQYCNTKTG